MNRWFSMAFFIVTTGIIGALSINIFLFLKIGCDYIQGDVPLISDSLLYAIGDPVSNFSFISHVYFMSGALAGLPLWLLLQYFAPRNARNIDRQGKHNLRNLILLVLYLTIAAAGMSSMAKWNGRHYYANTNNVSLWPFVPY